MKTGIILEISNNKAAVLKTDGAFVTLPAKRDWKKGEIITFTDHTTHLRTLCAIAACFFLLITSTLFGSKLYFKETALLSIDINPSIEISLNRSLRVVSVASLNDEGKEILSSLTLKNMKYDEAITRLLKSSSFEPYLDKSEGITFSLQTKNKNIESDIMAGLQNYMNGSFHDHHPSTKVDVYTVTEETVQDAHDYGITAGKYLVLQELLKVDPEADLNVYSHHSIDSIHRQIRSCEEAHSGVSGSHGGHCKHTDNGRE